MPEIIGFYGILMKVRDEIFMGLVMFLLLDSFATNVRDTIRTTKIEKLRDRIERKENSIHTTIPVETKKQERDSIATFNAQSKTYQNLVRDRKEKEDLQIKITELVEKSMAEYWCANFIAYKSYIDKGFSSPERDSLAKYVSVAHFTLSCDIDTNYYRSIDDILYGPYWREFAEFAEPTSPEIIKKYKTVRAAAESKYPYIHVRTVFYDGGRITTDNPDYVAPYEDQYIKRKPSTDTTVKHNRIFTECIKTGSELIRNKATEPAPYMVEFNRLHNISKIFTADIYFLIESPFIYDSEHFDLQSPLFAKYADQILPMIKRIMVLNPKIINAEKQHDADVRQIQQYFEHEKIDQIHAAAQQIEDLKKELAAQESQQTR